MGAQQMFGGSNGGYGAAGGVETNAPQPDAPASAPNPMAGMMQQMMSDPARMQQSMAMAQQLFGGGGAMSTPAGAVPTTTPVGNPMAEAMQRARFAGQLSQLVAMGFTNEAICLRVLAQHNGRIDAAIDALLASGEGSA